MPLHPNIEFEFTTGTTALPDVGELTYNGCSFSPLFESKISGNVVKDNANRTTKFMEYTITVDGYVTLIVGDTDINPSMTKLRSALTAQGGALTYKGRGFDLVVNANGNGNGAVGGFFVDRPGNVLGGVAQLIKGFDVAWGPVPELIEFQPLGGGLSAKIQWKVTVRIPEVDKKSGILQLNYETSVEYGEDGFSSLSIRGTLEIPITRMPSQKEKKLTYTVDDYRNIISKRILEGIDLSIFRVTRRDFNISRDKRTLEWDIAAEERPYMDPPPGCTMARGTYNVRPAKVGMGLTTWLCTLKATYTVKKTAQRRTAWYAFLALARLRMNAANHGQIPLLNAPAPTEKPGLGKRILKQIIMTDITETVMIEQGLKAVSKQGTPNPTRRAWLIDFSIDEGLYLDSKTISFSITWRLIADFGNILISSGIWTKVPEQDNKGQNLWAVSMKSISGAQSWLQNKLDPKLDVIVDFGSEV